MVAGHGTHRAGFGALRSARTKTLDSPAPRVNFLKMTLELQVFRWARAARCALALEHHVSSWIVENRRELPEDIQPDFT